MKKMNFTSFFREFKEEFFDLFEMARYAGDNDVAIKWDEYDLNFAKAVLEQLESLAQAKGITLHQDDKVDVLGQALGMRYGPKTLLYKSNDVVDIPFKLPNTNLKVYYLQKYLRPFKKTTTVRDPKKQLVAFHHEYDREKRNGGELSGVLKNIPMHPDQLQEKLNSKGVNLKTINWKDNTKYQQAFKAIDFFDKGGEPPQYIVSTTYGQVDKPPLDPYQLNDKEAAGKSEPVISSRERARQEAEPLATMSYGKIPLDDDDRKYLVDVRVALQQKLLDLKNDQIKKIKNHIQKAESLTVDHPVKSEIYKKAKEEKEKWQDKLTELKNKVEETAKFYQQQALCLRYSNYFVGKEAGKFVPLNRDTIGLRTTHGVTGKLDLTGVEINSERLSQKFEKYQHARDFVKNPLINIDTQEMSPVAREAASKWIRQGFYQPRSGHAGSHFVPDNKRLAKIMAAQEKYVSGMGETPNLDKDGNPKVDTPKVHWNKLLELDVRKGFAMSMSIIKAKMENWGKYEDMINSHKEEIIQSVATEVGIGLAAEAEYPKEEWRIKKAATKVTRYIKDKIIPLANTISATADQGEDGGGSIADLTAAPTVNEPEDSAEDAYEKFKTQNVVPATTTAPHAPELSHGDRPTTSTTKGNGLSALAQRMLQKKREKDQSALSPHILQKKPNSL